MIILLISQLNNVQDLELIINDLEFNEKLSSIVNIAYDFEVPELFNTESLEHLISQMEFNEKIVFLLKLIHQHLMLMN